MAPHTHKRHTPRLGVEALENRDAPAILYAVTNSQRLVTFDSSNPSVLLGGVSLTGMASPGEKITDIDFQPGTGLLYGRSDQGRIYLINPQSGATAAVSGQVAVGASVATAFNPLTGLMQFATFNGGRSGIDVGAGTSLPGLASSFLSGDLFQGLTPRLAGMAFTNNSVLPTATQMFGIDALTDTLISGIGLPEVGQFGTVGSLGLDVTNVVGFDVDPTTGVAYATFQPTGQAKSYFSVVNLSTGAAAVVGPIGPSAPLVLDIAVVPGTSAPGELLPAFVNPTTLGFTGTNLGTTIFGPNGLASGILSGVNPAFVNGLLNGITPTTISSLDPTILSGLMTGLNAGTITGIDPTLINGFNNVVSSFNAVNGLNGFANGLNSVLNTGLTTGLNSGLGTGLGGLNTGLVGNTLTTGLNTVLGTGLNTGFNTGLTGFNTLGGTMFGGGVPTSPLISSLTQPLPSGVIGSSIFNPGSQFGFGLNSFSGF